MEDPTRQATTLMKAIQRAVENGYESELDGANLEWFKTLVVDRTYPTIVFAHDFAKALFGDVKYEYAANGERSGYVNRGWMNHLTKMVLYENPLDYIEQYLNKTEGEGF